MKNPERNYLRWRIPVETIPDIAKGIIQDPSVANNQRPAIANVLGPAIANILGPANTNIPGPAAGDPLTETGMTNPNPSLFTGGYIQPFTDGPSNNPHNPAKAVCQQMIESSNRFVWITTPYLILEEDMLDSLGRSAESGVDVRIITPSIPDKWYVHLVTRSHYGRLLHSGVRIYEYTPGFMHAKMIVSDDEHALVGTVNFDFRSFYLQYENAVWFCNSPIVSAVRDDFAKTLLLCKEISYGDWKKRPWYQKVAGAGLRLFSTLM